jgi:hypothetical protein
MYHGILVYHGCITSPSNQRLQLPTSLNLFLHVLLYCMIHNISFATHFQIYIRISTKIKCSKVTILNQVLTSRRSQRSRAMIICQSSNAD